MKSKKQRFRPYEKEARRSMEHSIAQMVVARNELKAKELQYVLGLENFEEEVNSSVLRAKAEVAAAKMQVKAAEIQLKMTESDARQRNTEIRIMTNLQEAKNEIKRHEQNIEALTKQLKEGIPILDEEKNRKGDNMPEEPEIEKTPEEKEQEGRVVRAKTPEEIKSEPSGLMPKQIEEVKQDSDFKPASVAEPETKEETPGEAEADPNKEAEPAAEGEE